MDCGELKSVIVTEVVLVRSVLYDIIDQLRYVKYATMWRPCHVFCFAWPY